VTRDLAKLRLWQRRSKPLKKTPLRKRSKRQSRRERELSKSKQVVLARAGGMCEVPGCLREAKSVHHRRLRSQGRDDSPDNLIALCAEHHEAVHRSPAWAQSVGLVVMRKGTAGPCLSET
jgi:hypothetical protein